MAQRHTLRIGELGGILLEAYGALDRADFYILGIGLNTVPVSVTGRETAALRELTSAVPNEGPLPRPSRNGCVCGPRPPRWRRVDGIAF
jgi:hypothetical protein